MQKMQIPDKVRYILEMLENHGFEAYIVGGCVRDGILGRTPGDWDITTSARPWQVKEIFPRTIDTGIEHGTVTVMLDRDGLEVTTYRIDGDYEDGRHPKQVAFTGHLEDDLARRDFTINAMAYNPKRGIIDIFGGMEDLKQHKICCVGCAAHRFDEDALRILRAVRFSAQLDFDIEEKTAAAIREKAGHLRQISAERIAAELIKLLVSFHPEKLALAWELGITAVILPEYDKVVGVIQNTPNHIYTVDVHTIKAICNIEPDPVLRLTMLLHDLGKPAVKKTKDGRDTFYRHPEVSAQIAKTVIRRLKLDNRTLDHTVRLVQWHGLKYDATPVHVRRALNRVGADIFSDFLKVQRADVMAKSPQVIERKLKLLDEKEALYHQIIEQGQCFCVKMLDVNGRDLIEAGIQAGPLLGAVLDRLVERVIDHPELNQKDVLIEMALKEKDAPDIFAEKEYFFC